MSSSESKSIWNENPQVYQLITKLLFWGLTLFYPFVFYAVLWKSPKNFGTLKWFLMFHLVAISIQWLCTLFLIEFYTFVPSKITKLDGLLIKFIDVKIVYKSMYFVNSISSASILMLFCNRIFTIVNMYRGHKSYFRISFEISLYFIVFLMSLYVIFGLEIPEQTSVKSITKEISPYYPDCLDEPNVIVLIIPYPEILRKATIFFLIYLASQTTITFLTAQLAYHLLSLRMTNQSERTKKMHRKFNRRTFLQVLIISAFQSIPWTVSNLTTLFQWKIPELTYFVDFCSKNNPTACIVMLFLYYDPYQQWLKEKIFGVFGADKNRVVVKSSSFVKSGDN